MRPNARVKLPVRQLPGPVHPVRPKLHPGLKHMLPSHSILFQSLHIVLRLPAMLPGLLLV